MPFPSKVGVQTTHLVTQCLCNHLTFFGSSFFVTPNLVDPSRSAELFGTFVENPVVVCFVGALFVVYFLVLVWARRKDIQDVAKVGHICRSPLSGPQFVFDDSNTSCSLDSSENHRQKAWQHQSTEFCKMELILIHTMCQLRQKYQN